jgi:hypothetical protein
VVESVYHGSSTTYHVRLDDGQMLAGRAGLVNNAVPVLRPGDRAWVDVAAGGARVLEP